ncbi:hypothetical protein BofuT4_uP018650.1 [Botrytis cinerea T4]|uniref:Uncharacterized protein n=1 Tax=Botryotinia fuckeliana (strain T4) TaxID=999810 RepID=G2YIM2_BOTF4|nr:hypothetical protein BofuT4_uP018650.1 [Botrytis cinerea T4]
MFQKAENWREKAWKGASAVPMKIFDNSFLGKDSLERFWGPLEAGQVTTR